MVLVAFGVSLFAAFLSASVLIDRLKRAGIFGSDIHKPRGIFPALLFHGASLRSPRWAVWLSSLASEQAPWNIFISLIP